MCMLALGILVPHFAKFDKLSCSSFSIVTAI